MIPSEYRDSWEAFESDREFYHLTSEQNFESMRDAGRIEPVDPAPDDWAGMEAVFLLDPADPQFPTHRPDVRDHADANDRSHVVRLVIETANTLYRCTEPEETFQVVSLDPISLDDIVRVESVEG